MIGWLTVILFSKISAYSTWLANICHYIKCQQIRITCFVEKRHNSSLSSTLQLYFAEIQREILWNIFWVIPWLITKDSECYNQHRTSVHKINQLKDIQRAPNYSDTLQYSKKASLHCYPYIGIQLALEILRQWASYCINPPRKLPAPTLNKCQLPSILNTYSLCEINYYVQRSFLRPFYFFCYFIYKHTFPLSIGEFTS